MMDLRNERKVATPECFVCRWAGKHIVLWPQEKKVGSTWYCYVNVHENISLGRNKGNMRSKHTDVTVCLDHFEKLRLNWVQIAFDEVQGENAWYSYLERTGEW